jgi:hypothetical protein
MQDGNKTGCPLLRDKDYTQPSVFRPEHLLREARRQKGLVDRDVPAVCVLDPDGDLFRHARLSGLASLSPSWACYHAELFELPLSDGTVVGIGGNAVGAPFAVLVAEQLFASGCRFLISITSSGRIADLGEPPYVVLIDRALRHEGTSFHYLPASVGDFVAAPHPDLISRVEASVRAALYAFATARGFPVTCFAHVTNSMGQNTGDDFEKGEAAGTVTALRLIEAAAKAFNAGGPGSPNEGLPS